MGSTFSVPTCPDFVTMPLSGSGVDGTRNVLLVGCLGWENMRRGIDEIDRLGDAKQSGIFCALSSRGGSSKEVTGDDELGGVENGAREQQ